MKPVGVRLTRLPPDVGTGDASRLHGPPSAYRESLSERPLLLLGRGRFEAVTGGGTFR